VSNGRGLQIPDAAAARAEGMEQVMFVFEPKGDYKVDDDRGAGGKKREVDKIFAYGVGTHAHGIAQHGTNSKGLFFEPGYNVVKHQERVS
jgi:hypothetical protein